MKRERGGRKRVEKEEMSWKERGGGKELVGKRGGKELVGRVMADGKRMPDGQIMETKERKKDGYILFVT